MAAVCDICAKKPGFGNNRPWSRKITKRRFDPNIQRVRATVNGTPKRLNVCTGCIKAGQGHPLTAPTRPRSDTSVGLCFRAKRPAKTRLSVGAANVTGSADVAQKCVQPGLPVVRRAVDGDALARGHRADDGPAVGHARRPGTSPAASGPRRRRGRTTPGRRRWPLRPRAAARGPRAPRCGRRSRPPSRSARWPASASSPSETSIIDVAPASAAAGPASYGGLGRR